MSIQSIGSPTARPAERANAADAPPVPAPPRPASGAVDSTPAAKKPAPVPTLDQVKEAVASINKSLQTLSQDLVFSIDSDSNRTIVKIVDQKTKEVIRQIPTPEALEISKALDTAQGLLIKQIA